MIDCNGFRSFGIVWKTYKYGEKGENFMPNIKWIGFIDKNEIEKYQKGELDSNAIKMKMP